MINLLTLKPIAFGLDISDVSLKLVQLKKKEKFLSLASFGEIKLKSGIVENGEIKNEDELAKIIKEAISKTRGEKIKTKYVVASLPEEKAFLQVIQMPRMDKEELENAVYFEAENYIPLPLEQMYLDFQIVKPVVDHLDHLDVLIVALPKEIVNSYVSCLKKANLIPVVLELESQAIARALIKNGVTPFPTLIIDCGATKTGLLMFSGYSLRFTSSISISWQKLTQAISKKLNIKFEEAEKLKLQYGLEGKNYLKIGQKTKKEAEAIEVFKAISPLLKEFVGQIKDYLTYYHTHIHHEHLPLDSKEIERILLCGKGANLKGLTEFLSLELKRSVELGNPWVNILPEPLIEVPELPFEESLGFTTALGLSLRGIKL
jgi:type IV pilus assembly protein PilM